MHMGETLLQKLRIERNMSQSELAKVSGVNYRTLQDFEQGRKSLSNAKGEMIYRLSMALGCTSDRLLSESNPEIELEIYNNKSISHISAYYSKLSEQSLYGKYYKFPIIVQNDHIDMSRIYPTKQHLVSRLHEALLPDDRIVSVMLFGSSVTMQCHSDSDIDLSIRLGDSNIIEDVKNDVSEIVQKICDWKADILWFDRLSSYDRVYHEICKGVQIL